MGDMVAIDEQVFTDIADAIRDRNGEETTYKPREMAEAVGDLHNVRPTKWIRPSDWPDYSKVDLTDQEVIYLTYDCSYENRMVDFRVSGNYTVERGQINNGVFVPVVGSLTNLSAATNYLRTLPTDEGKYVVFKITPQEGSHITSFRFRNLTDLNSNSDFGSIENTCVERYCNMPYHTATFSASNNPTSTDCWTTYHMTADTVMGATPTGSCAHAYNSADSQTLKYLDLSNCSFKNVTSLASFLYDNCSLFELYLPHDLSNKCTSFAQTFQSCEKLVSLDLTGWDTSQVTAFNNMFYSCFALTEIKGIEDFDLTSATTLASMFSTDRVLDFDTSKWETSSALTNCSSVFNGCCSLKNINLNGFVTTNVTTFSGMFNGCESIKTIDLSNFSITSKTTSLSNMFIYCRNLETIIRNKDWDTSKVTTFEAMFQKCPSLIELDISDFDFSTATTVKNMFNGCSRLKNLKLTANLVKVTNRANVQGFLQACLQLRDLSQVDITNSIYMPNFRSDRNILNMVVHSSVTTIADYSLADLSHLRILDFRNHSEIPTLNSANDINTGKNTHLLIVVPDSLYDSWITATNWSNVRGNIISTTDYNNYIDSSITLANIDLSQCNWTKNNSSNANAAAGAAYSAVISGSGNRIASGLINVPTGKTLYISINPDYQYFWFGFDDNDGYTRQSRSDMKSWHTVPRYNTDLTKIALVVKRTDGTLLDPVDWADSGITVSYKAD